MFVKAAGGYHDLMERCIAALPERSQSHVVHPNASLPMPSMRRRLDAHLALELRDKYRIAMLVFWGPSGTVSIRKRLEQLGNDLDTIRSRVKLVDEEISLRGHFDMAFVTPCSVHDLTEAIDRALREKWQSA